jgi:hypothetical protein
MHHQALLPTAQADAEIITTAATQTVTHCKVPELPTASNPNCKHHAAVGQLVSEGKHNAETTGTRQQHTHSNSHTPTNTRTQSTSVAFSILLIISELCR